MIKYLMLAAALCAASPANSQVVGQQEFEAALAICEMSADNTGAVNVNKLTYIIKDLSPPDQLHVSRICLAYAKGILKGATVIKNTLGK